MNPDPLDYSHLALLLLGRNCKAPIQVRDIYFRKVRGHPYWPVQVCRVEEDTNSLVYYETGETNVVPKSSADLVPFTQQNIENLKLDQMKSRKLQKAIAAAKASMWVSINSILVSENDSALSIALVCDIVPYLFNSVVIADMLSLLIFLVLILTCNDSSLIWKFGFLKYIL